MERTGVPNKDWTDDELAAEAQTGTRGQGAVVEAMRRLRESNDTYSQRMFWLTIVLTLLTLVQAIAVVPVIKGWFKQTINATATFTSSAARQSRPCSRRV